MGACYSKGDLKNAKNEAALKIAALKVLEPDVKPVPVVKPVVAAVPVPAVNEVISTDFIVLEPTDKDYKPKGCTEVVVAGALLSIAVLAIIAGNA